MNSYHVIDPLRPEQSNTLSRSFDDGGARESHRGDSEVVPLATSSANSVFGLLKHWLCLDEDTRLPFDAWARTGPDMTGDETRLSLALWRVSAACQLTWVLVRKLVVSSLFVSVARGHMGDIEAIIRDARFQVLFIDDDNGLFCDEGEAEEILCERSPLRH